MLKNKFFLLLLITFKLQAMHQQNNNQTRKIRLSEKLAYFATNFPDLSCYQKELYIFFTTFRKHTFISPTQKNADMLFLRTIKTDSVFQNHSTIYKEKEKFNFFKYSED